MRSRFVVRHGNVDDRQRPPRERLATRKTSPLRTYQTTPDMSRRRVIRRATSSTVPTTGPRSTTSPTPYWSLQNEEDSRQVVLHQAWAPKPRATPITPALASGE